MRNRFENFFKKNFGGDQKHPKKDLPSDEKAEKRASFERIKRNFKLEQVRIADGNDLHDINDVEFTFNQNKPNIFWTHWPTKDDSPVAFVEFYCKHEGEELRVGYYILALSEVSHVYIPGTGRTSPIVGGNREWWEEGYEDTVRDRMSNSDQFYDSEIMSGDWLQVAHKNIYGS